MVHNNNIIVYIPAATAVVVVVVPYPACRVRCTLDWWGAGRGGFFRTARIRITSHRIATATARNNFHFSQPCVGSCHVSPIPDFIVVVVSTVVFYNILFADYTRINRGNPEFAFDDFCAAKAFSISRAFGAESF